MIDSAKNKVAPRGAIKLDEATYRRIKLMQAAEFAAGRKEPTMAEIMAMALDALEQSKTSATAVLFAPAAETGSQRIDRNALDELIEVDPESAAEFVPLLKIMTKKAQERKYAQSPRTIPQEAPSDRARKKASA